MEEKRCKKRRKKSKEMLHVISEESANQARIETWMEWLRFWCKSNNNGKKGVMEYTKDSTILFSFYFCYFTSLLFFLLWLRSFEPSSDFQTIAPKKLYVHAFGSISPINDYDYATIVRLLMITSIFFFSLFSIGFYYFCTFGSESI